MSDKDPKCICGHYSSEHNPQSLKCNTPGCFCGLWLAVTRQTVIAQQTRIAQLERELDEARAYANNLYQFAENQVLSCHTGVDEPDWWECEQCHAIQSALSSGCCPDPFYHKDSCVLFLN